VRRGAQLLRKAAAVVPEPPLGPVPGGQLLVLAKQPVPGQVKTRLCPRFSPAQAAELAAAALADTLAAVAATRARRRLLVLAGAPTGALPEGLSELPAGLSELPAGIGVQPQRGDGLAERIAAAYADAYAVALPMLLIGMDTPQLTATMLASALDALLAPGVDAVLGLAADGGWWAMGLRRPDERLLRDVPMSTPHTGRAQRDRLLGAGLRIAELPILRDVDTPADVARVAAAAPRTRFAATARALAAG
jgi:rSAM/selenodomain-associated transferase 1